MTSQLANEVRSEPAHYIHGPSHAGNLFQARTRNSALLRARGRRGLEPVFLNISEPPSPAERNCVIMLHSFYDSNQAHCLCKRAAPLCAVAEQPGSYSAQNESTAARQGRRDRRNVCSSPPSCKHQPLLSAIHANMQNKQGSARTATYSPCAAKQERTGG